MMAHDEWLAPEPRALSAPTLDLLRDATWRAWRASVTGGDGVDEEMRRAVAAVAAEAHHRGLRAEELIVAFKGVLEALAERDAGPSGPAARAFQSKLVTLCIKAYYGA